MNDWHALGTDPGCCAACVHPKVNVTRRGPAYLRCLRAGWDQRLPRYPSLPVRDCVGFEPAEDDPGGTDDASTPSST